MNIEIEIDERSATRLEMLANFKGKTIAEIITEELRKTAIGDPIAQVIKDYTKEAK